MLVVGSAVGAACKTSPHTTEGTNRHTCNMALGRLNRPTSTRDSSCSHPSAAGLHSRNTSQHQTNGHRRSSRRLLTRHSAASDDQQGQAGSSGTAGDGPSTSGRDHASPSYSHLPKQMVAAMALSPIAALSLPLVQSPSWQQSMHDFGEKLRQHAQASLNSDGFKQWAASADDGVTFMDWSYKLFGIDLSYVWDPELWVRFKEAVVNDTPALFWNKLWDRIEYRNKLPAAGLVGDMRISYAKFLELLEAHRIKRVIVYGDMRTAVVEVPHAAYASMAGVPGTYPFAPNAQGEPADLLVPNPLALDDPSQWFAPEMPEWNMEKYRFYVDLPGDFWEGGRLMDYLRSRYTRVHWDAEARQYFVPYQYFTKVQEVRTELQMVDPQESWDFLAWISDHRKLEFYEKFAALCLAVRGTSILVNLITSTALFKLWKKKTKKKNKQEGMWERMTQHTAKEFMIRDPKTGKLKDTGVRFADIAGMDDIVYEMREVVKMMLGDSVYKRVGAKAPRGIIFQGPPGTGKTYLARAIAGEAGLTFLSAVGSEFVEMFAGVAAARVNSLYHTARKKAPCIIFIDEMDAIGRSRTQLGGDPGSIERESALLSMLVQMDGINGKLEQVLTIGATNLAQDLDQALLRPGRFEVVYEIPAPGPVARMEILRYHSRNKQLDSDAMLKRVAEVTQGWSAASLANLMNEAAIMTVRKATDKITLPIILEIIDNMNFGPQYRKIPASEAKNRLALVTAAKAVALALCPGIEVIKFATLWSKKRGLGPYVEFIDSTENLEPDWHPEQIEVFDYATNIKVNAAEIGGERLGEFLHVASMLQPLYAGRALELELLGADQASLATAAPIADCFEIAYYCVRNSMLHPKFRTMPPLHTYIWLGEDDDGHQQRDPLSQGLDEELGYHALTLTLLKASWRRTVKMVKERRTAIIKVAEAMLEAEDETISGSRLVQIIESTPLEDSSDVQLDNQFLPILKDVLGKVPGVVLLGEQQAQAVPEELVGCTVARASFDDGAGRPGQVTFSRAAGPASPRIQLDDETLATVSRAIMGRLDVVDLVGRNTSQEVAERVAEALLDPLTTERLKAVRRYVEQQDGQFPPAPLERDIPLPVYGAIHRDLEWWKQRRFNVVTWSALDMLFDERQLKYYRQDADMPRPEDTTQGRKRAAEAQAAGDSSSSSSSGSSS